LAIIVNLAGIVSLEMLVILEINVFLKKVVNLVINPYLEIIA